MCIWVGLLPCACEFWEFAAMRMCIWVCEFWEFVAMRMWVLWVLRVCCHAMPYTCPPFTQINPIYTQTTTLLILNHYTSDLKSLQTNSLFLTLWFTYGVFKALKAADGGKESTRWKESTQRSRWRRESACMLGKKAADGKKAYLFKPKKNKKRNGNRIKSHHALRRITHQATHHHASCTPHRIRPLDAFQPAHRPHHASGAPDARFFKPRSEYRCTF